MSPCSSNFSIRLTSRYTATEKGGARRNDTIPSERRIDNINPRYDVSQGLPGPASLGVMLAARCEHSTPHERSAHWDRFSTIS